MHLVFFTHPDYLGMKSMVRYSAMLVEGMKQRGHDVQVWTAKPLFYGYSKNRVVKKWLGYIDQYIIFPRQVKKQIKICPDDTLFIFTDNALGPWVPLVAKRLHVIHCHDFLAQFSALGELPANPTSWTGKQYQLLIRKGFMKGKNFICVSQKTRDDLKRFLPASRSEVVYNGLNELFIPIDPVAARNNLSKRTGIDLSAGYILHIGGNQWYKNRLGVVEIYDAWRTNSKTGVPLLLIGELPSPELLDKYESSAFKANIHFIGNADDHLVQMAYSGASLFLFPSLMEGFGWPIAEAMACGTLVITTNEPPMTEVAGSAAFLIPCRPVNSDAACWAKEAGDVVNKIFSLSPVDRQSVIRSVIRNAARFNLQNALDDIEGIYQNIINFRQS